MAADVSTRYDAVLTENIDQVGRKIRLVDLGRGALVLACLLFGYALFAALFDLWLGGSDRWLPLTVRLAAFGALLVSVLVVAVRIVKRYLVGINPYYAARQLEETIPGSKNSLINWLDLKDEPLPPVIHQAVGARAAKDVKQADPELVTSPRDLWKLGASAGIFFLGLALLFAIVPRQFGSLMARAFVPLRPGGLVSGIQIEVIKPGVGDVTVPANQRVEFLARIAGRVPPANTPDAPALLYRYTQTDVPVRVPLEEDNVGNWGIRLTPDQLRTGLFWKITAGDAATTESQLRVRAQPFVTKFEATYNYRPYRKLAPETVEMPNELMPHPRLLGHRGTDVVLKCRVNTPVKSGVLELDFAGVKKSIPAKLFESEPQTLVFNVPLDKTGTFRVFFETPEGEKNIDRSPYAIDVMEDGVPLVELVMPGKDLEAPANGTVLLAGVALDDFGVTSVTLKLQLAEKNGPRPLAPMPYRPKTPIKFDNGTFPMAVQYVEVMALDKLRGVDDKILSLTAGQQITYWLEATDNNDFPRPNVGKSKEFKITIKDGLVPSKQQKEERAEAQRKKDKHEEQAGKDHDRQNQERNNQDNKGNNGPGDKQNPDPKNNDPKNDPKNNDQKNNDKGDNPKGDNQKGGNQPSPEQQQAKNQNDQQQNLRDQMSNVLDKLNNALNDPKNPNQKPPNDPKGDQKDPSNLNAKSDGSDSPNPKPGTPKKDSDNPEQKKDGPNKGGVSTPPSNPKDDDKSPNSPGPGGAGTDMSPGSDKNPPQKQGGTGGTGKETDSGKTKPDDSKGDDPNAGKGNNKTGDGPTKKTDKRDNPDIKEKGKTDGGETKPGDPNGKARPEVKADPPKGDGPPSESKNPELGKNKPANEPKGKAKDSESGDPGEAKAGPDGKLEASQAKDDGGKESQAPPTKDQVDALKKMLEKGGAEADAAAKNLAERGQDMKDLDLKKQLEDILKGAGREEDVKTLNGGREKLPMPQSADGKDDGPKDKGFLPKGGNAKKDGDDPSPVTGPEGGGLFDVLKKITPEEAFARRLGDLQLENLDDLKKRVTPDVLKKANIGDGEWQRFLDNARKYQDLLRQAKQRDDTKFLRGGAGKMTPQTPRQVQTNPGNQGPLEGAQAAPPYEFRDAQREFTRKK